ncbi:hypothetical protein O9G_000661 [Rozella allomycis CSF55]|uniref:Uncharacterized protein n=1 Tax=Rozella allomycis (strain CSF55) TaxID=988480 RepID=A0A075AY67_ROZAC|nr:hypothetical protein O9G_000661 [Rozella allomycis CSF55]|eukprot:EPZ35265.1 hypothetical protein O9G_000661 [Rozella allomycis CSF55]
MHGRSDIVDNLKVIFMAAYFYLRLIGEGGRSGYTKSHRPEYCTGRGVACNRYRYAICVTRTTTCTAESESNEIDEEDNV